MILKDAGLDFKRVPLPEHVVHVKADAYVPILKKGHQKAMIHDVKHRKSHEAMFRQSMGAPYESFVIANAKTKLDISFDKENDYLWLDFKDISDVVENNQVYVAPDVKATLIINYHDDESRVHHGLTRIFIDEGAELKLIKIQNMNLESQYIDHVQTEVKERGSFSVIDIQVGSENMIVNYDTNLLGYQSHCEYHAMYMASDRRGIDLSYTVNHIGKKSTSNILGKGVLGGASKKVFRGTLHFERGAVQSVGKEEEFVLLLSDDVKSDSIPALMCTEDDVIGEHGASIGQLDEDRLFYLMSRGLSEQASKLLVIQASYKEILQEIEDEDVAKLAEDTVDRSLQHVV